jgi:HK97 family phage major capsid protein
MTDIAELEEKLEEVLAVIEVLQEIDTEEITEEQEEELAEALAGANSLKKKIETRKATSALLANRRQTNGRPKGSTSGITDVRDAFEKDPKKGFEKPRDFFMAVREAALTTPDRWSPNLKHLHAKRAAGSDEHGVFTDPHGGFLVPVGFSPDVLSLQPEDDPVAGLTMRIPMGSPKVEIPARVDKDHSTSVSGGLSVSRKAETAAAQASRMEVEKITLTAHALWGLTFATEELLQDSPITVAAMLAAGFNDEFSSQVLTERIYGTGVGEFLGILNSPALVTVAKEGGQANSTINAANIINMRARCWRYGDAVWLANHDTLPQLATLQQGIGTGGQLLWNQNYNSDVPETLMGRPIIFSEYANTLGQVGDIMLVNWSQYLEAVYSPLATDESIHVRFDRGERAYRFYLRNAGAPWWSSPLTPKKGANTLSPFVTLAKRAA